MTAAQNKAAKLATAAKAAAEVRAYQTDPDVIALRIERVRGWVDRLIWTGMVLGLLFTMATVAEFAAGDARPPWSDDPNASISWVTAWLLDPMVSLVLIGVLMGEQVINRHGLKAGGWVRATKWATLGCTYSMNTWQAWAALDPAAILLHSVPPAVVFFAAEAVTTIRQRITEAVTVAHEEAVQRAAGLRAVAEPEAPPAVRTEAVEPSPTEAVEEPRTEAVAPSRTEGAEPSRTEAVEPPRTEAVEAPRTKRAPKPRRRTAKPSRTAGTTRAEQAAERAALSGRLADEMHAAMRADVEWTPDYPALIEETGKSRAWVEKRVAEARVEVAGRIARDGLVSEDAEPEPDRTRELSAAGVAS